MNFAIPPVDARHFAKAKPEVVPMGVSEIVDLVLGGIHAAGGDFMKQRFPKMTAGAFDERDPCLTLARETVAKTRHEFEASGSTPDDDDMMEIAFA